MYIPCSVADQDLKNSSSRIPSLTHICIRIMPRLVYTQYDLRAGNGTMIAFYCTAPAVCLHNILRNLLALHKLQGTVHVEGIEIAGKPVITACFFARAGKNIVGNPVLTVYLHVEGIEIAGNPFLNAAVACIGNR